MTARGGWSLAVVLLLALAGCGGREHPLVPADGGNPPLPNAKCIDNDGDGVPGTGDCSGVAQVDCDDNNPMVFPGAKELCDGLDNDCNGKVDDGIATLTYYKDQDGDGFGSDQVGEGCGAPPTGTATQSGDCNDTDPNVHPGAAEVCNDADDNCDGQADNGLPFEDFFADADGDGYGDPNSTPVHSCQATLAGHVANSTDCNDQDATVHPGATEICNGIDDNCDGQVDNGLTFTGYYPDVDGDGYGSATAQVETACAPIPGKVTNDADCDDGNAQVHPGAPEVCNGVDDNCNAQLDEGLVFATYYPDTDGDGYGAAGSTGTSSCVAIAGEVTNDADCNDGNPTVKPGAAELCNGADDNCDGQIDNGLTFVNYYADSDGDGYGAGSATSACVPLAGKVANNSDCNDANPAVHPGAAEVCNGIDDNCNGSADEGLTFVTYYPDVDGDGFGATTGGTSSCTPITGRVTDHTDCDDTRFAVHPGATEVCNGLDDNCNGSTDEGLTFTTYYPDVDGDGFGATTGGTSSCATLAGRVTDHTDCNDANPNIHPGAAEVCNGLDDNCDGMVDDGTSTQNYYPDVDGDGYGAAGSVPVASCAPVSGRVHQQHRLQRQQRQRSPRRGRGVQRRRRQLQRPDRRGPHLPQLLPRRRRRRLRRHRGRDLGLRADLGAGDEQHRLQRREQRGSPRRDRGLQRGRRQLQRQRGRGAAHPELLPRRRLRRVRRLGRRCPGVVRAGGGQGDQPHRLQRRQQRDSPRRRRALQQRRRQLQRQHRRGQPRRRRRLLHRPERRLRGGHPHLHLGHRHLRAQRRRPRPRCATASTTTATARPTRPGRPRARPAAPGIGVCLRNGTNVCTADQTGIQCSVAPGSPTAPACDGLDNDCDGLIDEPVLTATDNVTTTAWQDVEVAPYYFTSGQLRGRRQRLRAPTRWRAGRW